MDSSLPDYYSRRAPTYEEMYQRDDAGRQLELAAITAQLRELLAGRRVLDVACGTGFWEARIADVVGHVTAVDASTVVLERARAKVLPADRVTFQRGDAFDLGAVEGSFDAGLSMFWLSHVPRARLAEFLSGFCRRLEPGAVAFLADNVPVPGLGGDLIRKPGSSDTFKRRLDADGSTIDVLKNYFTADELRALCEPHFELRRVHAGACYWWLEGRVRG
jgi:SAM-dependent methyltransferase